MPDFSRTPPALMELFDPAAAMQPLDVAAVAQRNWLRCRHDARMCELALAVPRRVGGDARERARDKRRLRQLKHLYMTLARRWRDMLAVAGDTPEQADDDGLSAEAAQLHLDDWSTERLGWLQDQLRLLATAAVRAGRRAEGNRMVLRMWEEMRQLQRIG